MSTTVWLTTLQFAGVNAIFALSIYASLWTGVLSLATVVFGAFGGYSFAILTADHGVPILAGLVAGTVIGALLGAVTAAVVIRLESHYLAMATIAMVLISRVFVVNLDGLTGGAAGRLVPGKLATWAWLIGALAVSAYVLARLSGSRYGLAAAAVREDPAVAQTLAVAPRRIQFISFIISGALGGLAGVFQASFLQYIGPDTFFTALGFVSLAAVVLGGAYHWAGPIVGAIVFTILPQLLRGPMGDYDQLVTGVLLILIILYLPRGLVDIRWVRVLQLRLARSSDRPAPHAPAPAVHAEVQS
jgi:branched-chain amino acid transport system permease protein